MSRICSSLVVACVVCIGTTHPAMAVTMNTVFVGDPGNAGSPQPQGTFGAVPYSYRIGEYEVTNAQYAEFLNAKAASDPLALYNTFMGSEVRGGITRSGADGGYSYAAKTDMSNKPVNFVSWYDAVRFTNWLHNGQAAGNTESGAYLLEGGGVVPTNALTIARSSGALWGLPNENEWFKAAYYQPAAAGGDVDSYWQYPTASNGAPAVASAVNTIGPTRGDIANPGPNVANFFQGADWNGQNGNVTTVGTAGNTSHYGTFDQGGNVWEMNEELTGSVARVLRGGSWVSSTSNLAASFRFDTNGQGGSLESIDVGFRVVEVPEPSSLAITVAALVGICCWRIRRRDCRNRQSVNQIDSTSCLHSQRSLTCKQFTKGSAHTRHTQF